MTDIAIRFGSDAAQGEASGVDALLADMLLGPTGPVADDGLGTAVLISLFTDRLALPDDTLPDLPAAGLPDRRGWWGDGLGPAESPGERIGSRLWLLARAKRTTANLRLAEGYAREALAWMITDGIASAITASAEWGGDRQDQLRLTVTITRPQQVPARYELAWSAPG